MHARISALVLAFVLALTGLATAQSTSGALTGRIVDSQGLAVPGATVTVTGPQGTRSVVTDSAGRFQVPFLNPGDYSIRAELQGFKAVEQKDIAVRLGQTTDLPLKMEVGGLTETVQVTGAAPNVDTQTTTIGANLNTDDLATIPVGRKFSDTLYLSPGVSSSGTLGTANPSISGASGLENQYVVDGTNVTNAGYGGLGSYSIIFGSLGNATPYDFIKEIQVKTGGYEAEYGQATGGVVNVITKSGSNAFRGSVFGYAQPNKLENSWKTFVSSNGSVQTVGTQANDAGAEVGGRIIKDRLFFFGAIDPSWQKRTLNAPPNFPLSPLGDVDRDRRTTSYAAKATLQMGSHGNVYGSFFGDPSHGKTGPQRLSSLLVGDTSSFSTLDYGGHQQTVHYDGVLTSSFLVEAAYARSKNNISELPSVNTWRITDQTVTPTKISGGIGRYEGGNQSVNQQYTIKATNVFSSHQLKYGLEFSDVAYDQFNSITGPNFVGPDGRTTATGAAITVLPDVNFGRIFRVTRANYNNGHDTTQHYTDLFIQDSWRITNRLTFNPGVRLDDETLNGDLIKDFHLKNNWAPRIGVAYDASGDGRTKIYGNYGIFYARVPNDLAARALSVDDGYSRIDYFDAGLTRLVPQGTPTQTAPTTAPVTNHVVLLGIAADDIDPNAKLSYNNEVVLGVEREVAANTTFGVRYVFRNTPRVLEDVTDCPMAAYELPATAAVPCGAVYLLTNPSSATVVNPQAIALAPQLGAVKFDDPVHKYNSLEFTMNRHGANWAGTASYRYSRLRGNFEGFYRDDNGQSDPGISSLYDFPTNDPTYTTNFPGEGDIRFLGDKNGILPLDRPHAIKLFGNRMFGGLNLGANVSLNSGKPLTAMAANPVYDSAGEIPVTARGGGVQTIDGFKKRTPFESQIDLQAGYSLALSGTRKVTLIADVFNLFNEKRTTGYDQDTELNASTPNPDFGKPIATILGGSPAQFQAPRNLRVGVRFEF